MKHTIKRTFQVLFLIIWFVLPVKSQPVSTAYPTGNYVFCGNEIPKKFTYLIERKVNEGWKPVAELRAPQSETECMATIMQLPVSIAAITPISKATISFVWGRIQKSDVIDSLYAYGSDPRYQHVAQTGWFDEGIHEPGVYTYRIKKVSKNGQEIVINEVKIIFPSTQSVSKIIPVRYKLNENSISISYSIADHSAISGIKLYRSPYLKKAFTEVPVELMYTRQKGEMVAVLTDDNVSKGLTYSYVAQPYDALGNLGKATDTLNVYFVAKPADLGLVTKLQAIPIPEKGGNLLKWDFNYSMNVNTIDVYRSASYDGPYQLIIALNPKKKEYFDSRDICPAITYYYYISINNGVGESLPSARVPVILEGKRANLIPPQDLVVNRKENVVTLNFRRIGNDIRGYYVYRGDGYVAPLKQLPRMVLSTDSLLTYTDTLPRTIISMVYSYAVASVNSSYNISPQSKRVSVSYSGGRLPVPDKVNAMPDNDHVLITWSDVSSLHAGVSSYRVFRKTIFNNNLEKPEELIATTGFNINSFSDRSLLPGRYYSYRVQCVGSDSLDVGSISQPAGILYKADPLLQPGNVIAIPSENKIILKWTLPEDKNLISSLIYRSTENGQPVLLKESDKTTETFEDNTAAKNIRYFYFIVLKYKNDQTSVPTDAVSAKWE
ncbi:MAG TPA: hypothetical protein PKH79_04650 [Prolixibacteraceae bacterium]|nr:hypothetical protein [Prolixibacteraceae bacterium]